MHITEDRTHPREQFGDELPHGLLLARFQICYGALEDTFGFLLRLRASSAQLPLTRSSARRIKRAGNSLPVVAASAS